jgi:hypothetical protein
MKTPVILVAAVLTVAILLTASLLIATGTRGAEGLPLLNDNPANTTGAIPSKSISFDPTKRKAEPVRSSAG